jgi:hypothetical protein
MSAAVAGTMVVHIHPKMGRRRLSRLRVALCSPRYPRVVLWMGRLAASGAVR